MAMAVSVTSYCPSVRMLCNLLFGKYQCHEQNIYVCQQVLEN